MIMKYVIIVSFLSLTLLLAEENVEVIDALEYDKVESEFATEKIQPKVKNNNSKTVSLVNATKEYKYDSQRQHMLRRAKYLKKKYEKALSKLENWEMKKELLKKKFLEKNRKEETAFGDGNSFGKKRAAKRRRDFYKSLEVQEQHIQELADDASMQLANIKDEFLFQYAVPLTDTEINGVGVPVVEEKEQRVQMLNDYINENVQWQKCMDKVREFDKVNSVALSIEKLFPHSNITQAEITKKMEENKQELINHINRYQDIEQMYQSKYGLAIVNSERAKKIIQNINNH
jgi:hypothetical protein